MAGNDPSIRDQILNTQRAMVVELVKAVRDPSFGIADPSVAMFGRQSTEGFWRFLQQSHWDLEKSVGLLQSACEWHAKAGPAVKGILEKVFSKQPAFLSLRQVGFDVTGRPVLYGCFAQNSLQPCDLTVDNVIAHFTHLAENAGKTNIQSDPELGATNHIILDCSGFDARLLLKTDVILKAYQTLTLLYPNVIKAVLVVNYTQDVRNTWSTVKGSFGDSLAAKVKFVPPATLHDTLADHFNADLVEWLQTEMKLNKETPLPASQVTFYKFNAAHDPRGSAIYTSTFLGKDGFPDGHRPHGGILFG